MLLNILAFRIKYIIRFFKTVGLFYSAFVLIFFGVVVSGIFSSYSLEKIKSIDNGYYIAFTIGYILLLWVLHAQRRDVTFLTIALRKSTILFFIEYIILSIPLWIILVEAEQYLHILSSIVALFFIPLVPTPRWDSSNLWIKISKFFTKKVPAKNFEWLGGLRSFWPLYILSYLITFLVDFKYAAVIVSFLLVAVIHPYFYQQFESVHFMRAQSKSPVKFLLHKIILHYKWNLFYLLPVLGISFFYFFDMIIVLALLLMPLLSIGWLVSYKYYKYYHAGYPNLGYKYIISIGAFLSFLIIPFIFILFSWKKITENIAYYIDD